MIAGTSDTKAHHLQHRIDRTCGKEAEPSHPNLLDSKPTKEFGDLWDLLLSSECILPTDPLLDPNNRHAYQHIWLQNDAIGIHTPGQDPLALGEPDLACPETLVT